MPLTKQELLAKGPKVQPFEAPEWGPIHLKAMTVSQLMIFEARKASITPLELYPLVVLLSVCDEAGNLIFDDSDFDALKESSFETLRAIGDASLKLSKIAQGSEEDLAKNS